MLPSLCLKGGNITKRNCSHRYDKDYTDNIIGEYLNNKKPIPYSIYIKYCNIVKIPNRIVEFKCEKCGEISSKRGILIENAGLICPACLLKVNKAKRNNVSKDIYFLGDTRENPISWEIYQKFKEHVSSKKFIKINCSICKKESVVQVRKFENRKYCKSLPICSNCIMKEVCNDEEWKNINREAQLIAQNAEGRPEKMSETLKNKILNDSEFYKKITAWSDKLCGVYDGIRFLSSWELSVIYLFHGYISNSEIKIKYINSEGKEKIYLPDFDLHYHGLKILIEVKGKYKEDDYLKIKTAKKLILENKIDYDYMWVIDGSNIYDIDRIIIFDNLKKLNDIFDNNKLLSIKRYPKSWK